MNPFDLIANDALQCAWGTAPFLFISDNVFSPLIYYSHIMPALAGLFLAFVVWRQKERFLTNHLFIYLALAFSLWCLLDLMLWAHENPSVIMFVWSSLIYIEPTIYLAAAYLLYVFTVERDISFKTKLFMFATMLPPIVLGPTHLNLSAFDYTNCDREAVEGPLWYYIYFLEVCVTLWMVVFGLHTAMNKTLSMSKRVQVGLLTTGLTFFFLAFSWGNIVGSFSADWALAQYGLFGMPVFLGSIIYLIVRFQTFRIRVLGVTTLVGTLWILLFSILFLQTIDSARPVILITLVFFGLLGFFLVRSVQQEIQTAERLKILTVDLEKTNGQLEGANMKLKELDQMKSEFLSIASHQLRAPITAVRGYAANINEGEYGKVPKNLKEPLETVQESARLMAQSIEDYLNISRIEQGRMKFEKSDFDLADLAKKVVRELTPVAEKKKLKLAAHVPDDLFVNADVGKIKQVLTNLIDNAIKYTPTGSVTVTMEKKDAVARLTITDTGVGIPPEEIGLLFEKFKRARGANKVNTTGTGLGLYVAKQLTEGNGGKIWVESDGQGKGSRFIVELPAK